MLKPLAKLTKKSEKAQIKEKKDETDNISKF
jgi:hypothetical protein